MATEPLVNTGFEKRWAAWQAQGATHDRASRRRFRTVAMLFIVLAAAVTLALWWL